MFRAEMFIINGREVGWFSCEKEDIIKAGTKIRINGEIYAVEICNCKMACFAPGRFSYGFATDRPTGITGLFEFEIIEY